jgi:hypothetical protein
MFLHAIRQETEHGQPQVVVQASRQLEALMGVRQTQILPQLRALIYFFKVHL